MWEGLPENFKIEEWFGFIYKISNSIDGKYYIGKKFFWRTLKRPPLKGKKNKRHEKQESDWKEYWGSSNELLADIQKLGKEKFKREIIGLYSTRWDVTYHELIKQIEHNAIFDPNSYNQILNVRLCRKKKYNL